MIWKNLDDIYKRFPDYYARKTTFLATLHPQHNYEGIDRFFLDQPERFDISRLIVSSVRRDLLKDSVKEKWFNDKTIQTSQLVNIKSSASLNTRFSLKSISWNSKFTGMCFPGEIKYFVASKGDIYICERVKEVIPIGNVEAGLDYEAIRKIQRLWNEEIIRNRCWECPAVMLCNVCLAQSGDKDGVGVDCTYKNIFQNILADYLTYKEDEKIKENAQPGDAGNSIKEYFRQL